MGAVSKTWLVATILVVVSLPRIALAESNAAPRLEMDVSVKEGSRLIGQPIAAKLPLRTTHGEMTIDLRLLAEIKPVGSTNSFRLRFLNGDVLTGSVDWPAVIIDTVLGRVNIPLPLVASIRLRGDRSADLRHDLLLLLAFDRLDGEFTPDASGKGHQGLVTGATSVREGRHGSAFHFDGVDDTVRVDGLPPPETLESLTFAAWFRPDRLTPFAPILGWNQSGNWGGSYVRLNYNGKASLDYRLGSGTGNTAPNNVIATDNARWCHIAVTHDPTQASVLYVDGKEVHRMERALPLANHEQTFWIGGGTAGDAGWHYFAGLIDDVRIYARALSPAEIQALAE